MATDPIALERAVELDAAPDAVYAVVADVARRPSWLGELRHVEWDGNGRPATAGDRFEGQSSLLFHDFIGHSEVVVAEPAKTIAERVHLGARFVSRWTFDPTPQGGTRVTHCIEIDYPDGPLGRLERWVLRRRLRRMQARSLDALARELS